MQRQSWESEKREREGERERETERVIRKKIKVREKVQKLRSVLFQCCEAAEGRKLGFRRVRSPLVGASKERPKSVRGCGTNCISKSKR